MLTAILTSAIASCGADGAWEQATDYLTDIRMANGGAIPPASAYAAAANACARAGQGVRAQALIAELDAGSGERPDIECYNAVIYGYAMTGDLEGVTRTLKEDVPNAGLKPNTRGFNHAIAGCARAGEWKMALALFDEQRSGEQGEGGEGGCFRIVVVVCWGSRGRGPHIFLFWCRLDMGEAFL